jgi:hypothetical protein
MIKICVKVKYDKYLEIEGIINTVEICKLEHVRKP